MKDSKKDSEKLTPFRNTIKKLSDQLTKGGSSQEKTEEYEAEIEKLQIHIKSLEEELNQLYISRRQYDQINRQNEKLVDCPQRGQNTDRGP